MKNLLTILAIVFVVGQTWAQTPEYLQQKDFKVEKQKIYEGINASRKQLNEVKKADLKMGQSVDSLKKMLAVTGGQLSMVTDSLSKTSIKLNALQEKVDGQKFLSRGVRILIILILLLVFAGIFAMLFLSKKKTDLLNQSLDELDKKTNDRLDLEMKNMNSGMQSLKELMASNANEMNQRISAGLSTLETRSRQLEVQLQEPLARIESRIDIIGPEINKLKEEQSGVLKALEDKLNTFKRETEQKNQVLAAQAAKLEEEVRSAKGKH